MKILNNLLTLTLVSISFLPASADHFVVEGTLNGLPDGTSISLRPVAHVDLPDVVQTTVTNGNYRFEGDVEQPTAVFLLIDNSYTGGRTRMMLSEGSQTFSADVEAHQNGDSKTYSLSDEKFEGTELSDYYRDILSVRDDLDDRYAEYHQRYSKALDAMSAARSEGDQDKINEIAASEEYKAFEMEDKAFFNDVENAFTATIMKNKDTFWGPLAMISLLSYLNQDSREMFDSFSQEAKDSYYGRQAFAEMYPIGKIGDEVPRFSGKNAAGKELSLMDVCEGKKYILIDFWASWCKPCRREIPNLQNIYEKHKDKGFEILSVSIDADEAPWLKAVDFHSLQWPNLRDADKSIANLYKVSAVPTMYLVDADGRLVGENLRGEMLSEFVDKLFSE